VEVDLRRLVETRHVAAEYVLEPAHHLHPAAVCRGQRVGDEVVCRMVRCPLGRDAGVAVVLWMGRREVAAAKTVVVFLFAVIRQRLAAQLPAADTATVGERGEKQRVDRRHFLEAVEHRVGAFVDERHGPHLNPDHRRIRAPPVRRAPAQHGTARDGRGRLQEQAAIHRSLLHRWCLLFTGSADQS